MCNGEPSVSVLDLIAKKHKCSQEEAEEKIRTTQKILLVTRTEAIAFLMSIKTEVK